MPLYSIDKLINETRRLAAEFKNTTGTMLPVSGEIARYDVSLHMDLTLDTDNHAYDATGNSGDLKGLRVMIKSRVIGDSVKSGHRIGQLNPDGEWDVIILSLMDNNFEPIEMYQLSRETVAESLGDNSQKKSKRGAISVAKFKVISDLVWSREDGENDGTTNEVSQESLL